MEICDVNSNTHTFIKHTFQIDRIIQKNVSSMKTCSSLVKIFYDWENIYLQNTCNKCMRHRNILPSRQTINLGSSQLKIKAVATVDYGSIMCCDIGAIRQSHGWFT